MSDLRTKSCLFQLLTSHQVQNKAPRIVNPEVVLVCILAFLMSRPASQEAGGQTEGVCGNMSQNSSLSLIPSKCFV